MVGKRREKFNPTQRPQKRVRFAFATNPAGKRSLGTSGGKGGGSFADPTATGLPRRRQPQNPHDPTSKDPFIRAGIGMGTNNTKIFKRAGINMGGL